MALHFLATAVHVASWSHSRLPWRTITILLATGNVMYLLLRHAVAFESWSPSTRLVPPSCTTLWRRQRVVRDNSILTVYGGGGRSVTSILTVYGRVGRLRGSSTLTVYGESCATTRS